MTAQVTHISARASDTPSGAGSLAEAVYEQVLALIVEGELVPGTKISEVQLAERLGVSRTPVHTAIRELVKDGLMSQRPGHRPVVAAFGPGDLDEIFDMRALLEAEAAARAATRIDRATLARLRQQADEVLQARGARAQLNRWATFDEEFHRGVAWASGSSRLAADIGRYRLFHRGLNKASLTPELMRDALREHMLILDALAKRDASAARAAMAAHIHEWRRYYARRFRASE